jgi:hypothetical protein
MCALASVAKQYQEQRVPGKLKELKEAAGEREASLT